MKLIIVGGFLGAGKTTLLWAAARALAERGFDVGLVTNDQAPELVDTAFLSRSGAGVEEVAGSCFCCNFEGLTDALASLGARGADCVIAEPVGSCTDLSATLLQPLKALHPEIDLAPLTVLVDPARLCDVLGAEESYLHDSALYILRLQIGEADRVLVSKADTLGFEERSGMADLLAESFAEIPVAFVSALTGEGVAEWLSAVLAGGPAGTRIVEVDYDRYAEGEAVLGWLNAGYDLHRTAGSPAWGGFMRRLIEELRAAIRAEDAEVGHVKLLLEANKGSEPVVANLTSARGEPAVWGPEDWEADEARLTVNARVQMPPEELRALVQTTLRRVAGDAVAAQARVLRSLRPGRPQPTHRYGRVVDREP